MIKFVFLSLMLLFSTYSHAQKSLIEISSPDPADTVYTDFKKMGINFNEITVISLGESTHGTAEFTLMRHRLFSYLVENHDFNTLFLELDYSFGLLANSYVQNERDYTDEEILISLKYWPSQSKELLDLLKWIRLYNETHSNELKVVGTEGQEFSAPFKLMVDFFSINEITFKTDSIFYDSKVSNEILRDKLLISNLLSSIEESKKDYLNKYSDQKDSLYLTQLINNIHQSIRKKSEGYPKNQTSRNKSISDNILFQINNYPNTKGMYIAQNGHIFNSKHYQWYAAGYFLKKELGNHYFSIAQDFYEGSFIAGQLDSSLGLLRLKSIHTDNTEKFSLTNRYKENYKVAAYIPVSKVKRARKMKLHMIGSRLEQVHGIPFEKNIKGYDGVILIKKSTPLQLLLQNED